MGDYDAAEVLRMIIRNEIADVERSIRDRDPVRALNALADAVRKLKSLVNMLDYKGEAESGDPSSAE